MIAFSPLEALDQNPGAAAGAGAVASMGIVDVAAYVVGPSSAASCGA